MNAKRIAAAAGGLLALGQLDAQAADDRVERGRYLVDITQCSSCHTPGALYGKFNPALRLAGSDTGYEMPGLGIFYGPNLTPDPETGLGNWSEAEIAAAITTGVTPGGRTLVPAMPSRSFAKMSKDDALAIAAYLKSLRPLKNKVAGPLGPDEKPVGAVVKIQQVK